MDLRETEQQTKLYLYNNMHRAGRENMAANVPSPRPAASKKKNMSLKSCCRFLAESAEICLKNAYIS